MHGALYGFVGFGPGGYVDERDIGACAVGQRMLGVVEAEGFAYAPSHEHAVDCVAESALWHDDYECEWGVAASVGVGAPYGAQRVGECSGAVGCTGKKRLDRCGRAEALFLV